MSTILKTPLDEIPQIRDRLRAGFTTGKTRDVAYRKAQLIQLGYLVQDNRQRIYDALYKDMHRSSAETAILELGAVMDSAKRAIDNVKKWASPERAPMTLNSLLARPTIYKEPKGTVLIIGPFNLPIYCNFLPLIGAIAAGCAVVVKPSEFNQATTALLTELFPKYLDTDLYTIVNGAVPETKALLELQWDHIFFTGSTTVGRIVSRAAAEHLTPVTLELGGKNSAIIDKTADLERAARVILWAKNGNSGQVCLAPDFVMVHKDVHTQFMDAVRKVYKQFFPDPASQKEMQTALIHAGAYKRIVDLLTRTKGTVAAGGGLAEGDESINYIPTTVVDNVTPDDALMEAEIFGPILPVTVVDSMEDAVKRLQSRESPLAYYVFTNNSKTMEYIRANTRSGAIIQNDNMLQGSMWGLPFGGVGQSGHGTQNGKYAFDTFVYLRAGATIPSLMEKLLSMRLPPYTESKTSRVVALTTPKITYARPGTASGTPWTKLDR